MYQVTIDFNDGKGIHLHCKPVSLYMAVQDLVDLLRCLSLDSKFETYTYNIIKIKD